MKKLSEFSYPEHTSARIAVQDLLREFCNQMQYLSNQDKELIEVIKLVLSDWKGLDNNHPKLIKKHINEEIKRVKEDIRFEYTNPDFYKRQIELLEEAKKQISKK